MVHALCYHGGCIFHGVAWGNSSDTRAESASLSRRTTCRLDATTELNTPELTGDAGLIHHNKVIQPHISVCELNEGYSQLLFSGSILWKENSLIAFCLCVYIRHVLN